MGDQGIEEARRNLAGEISCGRSQVVDYSKADRTDFCYLCGKKDNGSSILVQIVQRLCWLNVTSRFRVHVGCYEDLVKQRAKGACNPSRQ